MLHCLPREVLYYPDGSERADCWDVLELHAEYRLREVERREWDLAHGSPEQKDRAAQWFADRRKRRAALFAPDSPER